MERWLTGFWWRVRRPRRGGVLTGAQVYQVARFQRRR